MQIECGHCGNVLEVPAQRAGKEVLCSRCGTVSRMPGGALSFDPSPESQEKNGKPVLLWMVVVMVVIGLGVVVVKQIKERSAENEKLGDVPSLKNDAHSMRADLSPGTFFLRDLKFEIASASIEEDLSGSKPRWSLFIDTKGRDFESRWAPNIRGEEVMVDAP